MTMTLPAGSLDEARQFYADAGLPFPPLPAALEAAVAKQDETAWGTRPADPPLYAIEAWVNEAIRGDDFVLVGMDGHGYNSWATHLYVVQGPVGVLVQVAAGGALLDPDEVAKSVEGAWGMVKRLLDVVTEAAKRGKLPPDRRLVVVDSDFGDSRWAWVDPNASTPPEWQVSAISPVFAATTDVLLRIADDI